MSASPRHIGALVAAISALHPQALAAGTANGVSIDRSANGGIDSAVFLVKVGAVTGTPSSFTLAAKLQDSADGSAWADVVADGINTKVAITTLTAINTKDTIPVDLTRLRRFVRVAATAAFVSGTSPTVLVDAACVADGTFDPPTM